MTSPHSSPASKRLRLETFDPTPSLVSLEAAYSKLPFLVFDAELQLVSLNGAAREVAGVPRELVDARRLDALHFFESDVSLARRERPPLKRSNTGASSSSTGSAAGTNSGLVKGSGRLDALSKLKNKLSQMAVEGRSLAFGKSAVLMLYVGDTPEAQRVPMPCDALVTLSESNEYAIVLLRPALRTPTGEEFKQRYDAFLGSYGLSQPPPNTTKTSGSGPDPEPTNGHHLDSTATSAPQTARHPMLKLPLDPDTDSLYAAFEVVTEKVSSKKSDAQSPSEEHHPKVLNYDELTRLVQTIPQIWFTSEPTGQIDFFNAAWYRYTGLSETESMDFTNWTSMMHPKDLERVLPMWVNAISTGSDFRFQYRLKGADGVLRWCVCQGTAVKDENGNVLSWACSVTQVEDLVQAQAEAQRMQGHIRAVLSGAQTALLTVDRQGVVTFFEGSDRAARSSGHSSEEAVVGTAFDRLYPDERLIRAVEAILNEEEVVITMLVDRIDDKGQKYTCRFRLVPLRSCEANELQETRTTSEPHPPPDGVIIVAADVTELIEKEEALRKVLLERSELQASETAAKEASRLKTEFLTTVSHEIRSPISAILGICELLLDDAMLNDEARALVNKATRSGELLLDLVGMVLDVRKVEVGELELEEMPLELHDLLADAQVFSVVAAKRSIEYIEDIGEIYQGLVLGDRLRLRQILNNSLSNAFKFERPGGTIALRVRQELETKEMVHLVIEVQDTGVGIDADVLPTLFQPFRQADASTARRFGGSGLGLVIVKSLLELMGGSVELQSILGAGTTMRIRLPLKKTSRTQENPLTDQMDGLELETDRRPEDVRILVAEDNELIRDIVTRTLAKMRFNVTGVDDGVKAISAMEADPFDLILMDGQMPGLDGYQATAHLRRSPIPRVRDVKIIALTASAIQGDKERCLASGMDAYLAKPVRAKDLERSIWEQLEK